ncbi:MAG TPA: hypothetical protein PLN31_09150 [Azoarcus taiwanensis]|nr:hypothetical protein [Azoarcus taiwanensis]
MRPTNPLITIMPAMPPAIGEIECPPARSRVLIRVLGALLALVVLGAALFLSLPLSSS